MYYDTFAGFVGRAARYGFRVTDVRERTLQERQRVPPGLRGFALRVLRTVHADGIAYRAYRFGVLGTFELVLRPNRGAS
jgi:hypothetical protein